MSMENNARAAPGGAGVSDFATALRHWRGKRGLSQLALSMAGAVSQRHISFLESGRAQPSRDLIVRLVTALEIPLRHRNLMLLAAGFAPAYAERKLADPELAVVRQALAFMLDSHAPFPALVIDRLWNLQMANLPATRLIRWLLAMPDTVTIPTDGTVNILRLMLDPDGLRRYVVNWREVCADMLHWIRREAMSDGPGSAATVLLAELTALAGAEAQGDADERGTLPFLPVVLQKDGVTLNLFTTIATLGTPRDVTLHELRIESFFAADAATKAWFAAGGTM